MCLSLHNPSSVEGRGGGGGLVVSVLVFYSDNPSSIPAEVYNLLKKRKETKRGQGWPI